MGSSAIVESVTSLFIIILVGAYSTRRGIITPELNKGLVNVLIQIALPFMILSSFVLTFDNAIRANIVKTFYYSIAAYGITILASHLLLLPVANNKKTILHFANVFTNTGYVGFPILNSIYGTEGVVYGSIFNMFFVILVWTYGIVLYRGTFDRAELRNELRKVLVNPSIMAVCIGLIIMTFGIRLPNALLAGIRTIGNMTGPLSMIIIGVILSNVKFREHVKDWTIYYGVATKLVIIPFTIYALSLLIGKTSIVINTVVIMTAMPASTMTSILAERFDREKDYAAVIVSMTTLLSLITATVLLKIIL